MIRSSCMIFVCIILYIRTSIFIYIHHVHTKIRIMIHHMHRTHTHTHTHLLEQNNIQTNRDLKDCYARINTIIRYLII